jgi:UDP-N-acetylmuramate dehydrogenase
LNLQKNVLLKNYSTFKIGGSTKYFCACEKIEEIEEALKWADDNNQKFFILGGGSNVLFGDKGFDGLVIKIENKKTDVKGTDIICGAGVKLSRLLPLSMENNLVGLEWAAGIPGTVGGAVRGNAGAFGGEMSDVVQNINVLKISNFPASPAGRQFPISNKNSKGEKSKLQITNYKLQNCQFGYRESVFKQDKNLIIWEVELELQKGDKKISKEKIGEILLKRKENQPLEYPSVGSIFKNPVVNKNIIEQFEKDTGKKCKDDKVPVGWLIESCGLKGKKIGGAQVSEKHANFIINNGNATAEDVIILISLIKQKVRRHFNVQLREEIEIVI